MILNRFTSSIFFQIILLGLTSFAFIWTLSQEYMLITSSSLVLVWIGQVFYLFYFINRIHRDLQRFIDAFKNQDPSLMFKITKGDRYFVRLYESFNEIIKNFKLIRIEKEVEHQFFQNTISHVGIGLVAFDSEGDVELINDATLNLLKLDRLNNIIGLDLAYPGLSVKLEKLEMNEQQFIKLLIDGENKHFSIKATEFKLEDNFIKLIAIQDITKEIDKSEVEAWQKLIGVLRHEIMNSVSPINLLSGSLINLFETDGTPKKAKNLDDKIVENTLLGLQTIRKRSTGLTSFVESYRSLSKIPDPVITEFSIADLFLRVSKLFEQDVEDKGIQLNMKTQPNDFIMAADEKLVEQVLINLIKNALDAMEGTEIPEIILIGTKHDMEIEIQVKDNGTGMQDEVLENIFVPFYTSKEHGSGIGLSFSRQVMQLHNGSIKVQSKVGEGSVFSLHF